MLVELQYCALYQESIENCILFVVRFNDYLDNFFLELFIQQIAILCPFSADRSSELIRRIKFSDLQGIAVPYMFRVELGYMKIINEMY